VDLAGDVSKSMIHKRLSQEDFHVGSEKTVDAGICIDFLLRSPLSTATNKY